MSISLLLSSLHFSRSLCLSLSLSLSLSFSHSLSLSVSLSHSHTHTHTHSLSLSLSLLFSHTLLVSPILSPFLSYTVCFSDILSLPFSHTQSFSLSLSLSLCPSIDSLFWCHAATILLTKTTAAQKEVALSYHRVRGLDFLAVVFARSIIFLALHSSSLLTCYMVGNGTNNMYKYIICDGMYPW